MGQLREVADICAIECARAPGLLLYHAGFCNCWLLSVGLGKHIAPEIPCLGRRLQAVCSRTGITSSTRINMSCSGRTPERQEFTRRKYIRELASNAKSTMMALFPRMMPVFFNHIELRVGMLLR